MPPMYRRVLFVAGLLCLPSVRLSAEVTLLLRDGRVISADSATIEPNGDYLLTIERPGLTLTRRLPRHQVDELRSASEILAGRQQNEGQLGLGANRRTVHLAHQPAPDVETPSRRPAPGSRLRSVPYDEQPGGEAEATPPPPPKSMVSEHPSQWHPLCPPAPVWHGWFSPPHMIGLPMESVVIGVRDDPLETYAGAVEKFYPHGVPINEVPYVLDLLRFRKSQEVLSSPAPDRVAPPEGPDERPEQRPPGPPPRDPFAPPAPGVSQPLRAIQTISAEAYPISGHGQTDWDALAVRLAGVDRFGNPLPLEGTVTATLWGETQRTIRAYGREFFNRPLRIQRLGVWTRPATSQEPMVLPLSLPTPEHDRRQAPWGELHLQVAIPGEGVFETTVANVPLAHVSPLRDRLQIDSGSRFFPTEGTFAGRRPSGPMLREFSSFRPDSAIFTVQP